MYGTGNELQEQNYLWKIKKVPVLGMENITNSLWTRAGMLFTLCSRSEDNN